MKEYSTPTPELTEASPSDAGLCHIYDTQFLGGIASLQKITAYFKPHR